MKNFFVIKKIKVVAVLLALLVFFCSIISVSGIESGMTEADTAPTVYGAIYDFVKTYAEGSTASNAVQVGPQWYYEFSKSSSDIDWQLATRFAWGGWYPNSGAGYYTLGITQKGIMHLINHGGRADFSPMVAYKFVAPRDGYIYIESNTITHQSSTNNEYNAQIRITKNTETVYPASGYVTIDCGTEFDLKDVGFEVKKGDEVRFELKSDKILEASGDQLSLYWNPTFYLQNDAELYKGEGIFARLTDFMRGVFAGLTPETMDTAAESSKNKAKEATKNSSYGTYSALDAVYDGDKILASDNESVWKFGAEDAFSPELVVSEGSFSFTAEKVAEGVKIIPENPDSDNIFTVVAVNSKGESKTFVGIKDSLVIPNAQMPPPFKVQVKYGTKASEILYLTEESGSIKATSKDDKYLLNDITSKTDYIRVSSAITDSFYDVYYKRDNTANERTIKYTAVKGEKMRFGFTAPHSGQYEISAPISVTGAETYYSVVLESTNQKILTPVTKYKDGAIFCESQVFIKKGETLWFEAYSLDNSVIDIGVPKVTYKNTENVSGITYRYVATDYVENKTANGYTYSSAASTENKNEAWSFGYFDTTARKLIPYTLIKDGFYYCKDTASNKNSVASLYPTFGENSADTEKPLYNRNKFYGTVDYNTGIYMKFTAPVGANAVLTLTDGVSGISGVKVTVLKNAETAATYTGKISAATSLSLGILNPNDTVTLMIESTTGEAVTNYLGSPTVTLSGYISSVNFKTADGTPLYNVRTVNSSVLKMPSAEVYSTMKFLGWANNKDNARISEGSSREVTSGIQFNTDYNYYGDIDFNNIIDGDDYETVRKVILGEATDGHQISDIKTDGNINVADLLRLKKLLVNGECSCN